MKYNIRLIEDNGDMNIFPDVISFQITEEFVKIHSDVCEYRETIKLFQEVIIEADF